MTSQEDQDRALLTFPVDTFTVREPTIPRGAPFSVGEFMRFDTAYRQFVQSKRNLDLTFLNSTRCDDKSYVHMGCKAPLSQTMLIICLEQGLNVHSLTEYVYLRRLGAEQTMQECETSK